jgi:hypothetical protein
MATINSWNNQIKAANVLYQGGTVAIGSDATDNAINIGTAASAGRTVTVGNATGTSGLVLTSASGNIAMNTGLTVNSGGIDLNTKQPMFCAYLSASVTNVTGDGTNYGITLDSTTINQSSAFNTGTHFFTAPVTGNYLFILSAKLTGIISTHTNMLIYMGGNNGYYQDYLNPYSMSTGGALSVFGSTICNMTASDVYGMSIQVNNGTKVIGLTGGIGYTCWMGYLIR